MCVCVKKKLAIGKPKLSPGERGGVAASKKIAETEPIAGGCRNCKFFDLAGIYSRILANDATRVQWLFQRIACMTVMAADTPTRH